MKNKQNFEKYSELFIEENHKVNLVSKNDEKFLWEKHICDSLSLGKFFDKYKVPETLLDIGTGGGFPSVPIAMEYPQIKITAIDSIGKKIRAVQNLKEKLNLNNLTLICDRVENISAEFDVVTSRAVASLDKICSYALPKTKNNGYFIAFKSQKAQEEITSAQKILKKYSAKIIDIIKYNLPTKEQIERNLIVIQKCN
ncbi:16S rRNA (guanine(527)-N(7))-methyltransferase RsmG [bacterium]|nr:16S rRNA (guanine(527)-N(7))-methyltransferase RsmG [bacterium]